MYVPFKHYFASCNQIIYKIRKTWCPNFLKKILQPRSFEAKVFKWWPKMVSFFAAFYYSILSRITQSYINLEWNIPHFFTKIQSENRHNFVHIKKYRVIKHKNLLYRKFKHRLKSPRNFEVKNANNFL